MEKKFKKNADNKKISELMSYIHQNHEEDSLKSSESDSESVSNNSIKEDSDVSTSEVGIIEHQLNIIAFESEDEILTDDEEAFTSFSKLNLPCNAAHLAVFINFTIVHSISEFILFYLITNLYANGNLKDMKKWAYEIYSSFLAPFAHLKVLDPIEHQTTLNDIEKKLKQISDYDPVDNVTSSFDFEMLRLLRDIFDKARYEVEKTIAKQLKEFQNKRKAGLETMYGGSSTDLKASKKSKKMQQVVVEKNLMPKLLQMLEDLDENNDPNCGKRLLVSALCTVIHKTFHPRTTYFEPIDQFVTQGNALKVEMPVKGHHLTPKTCYETTCCDFCSYVFWGISPQAYECKCGIKIHESCIEKISGICVLHKEENESDQELNDSKDSSKLMELVHRAIGNRRIENYKRYKGDRPKSDPGLYNISNNNQQASDSSDDGNLDDSIWSTDVSLDFQILSDEEKKRRNVIMELFETERRHVKTLKVLQNVFYEPLKRSKSLSSELANMLFPPSFFLIKDWHASFETMLKKEWREQHGVLLKIGDCLSIFEEPYGNILKENAALFCAGQKKALETLRITRIKNETLQRGLIKAESHKRCKRLQLKDLMLSVLQRLTKYPLLFERILKYSSGAEHDKIQKVCETSRMILNYVNEVIKYSEELQSIQMKLDKTYLKEAPIEFRNLNLTDYKLIFDGYVTMKKCPNILRLLLFENMVVILHKQEDKYILKPFDNMKLPIVKLYRTIIRSNAIDNKSFFLISQTDHDSQMLELIAMSEAECVRWIEKVSGRIEKIKERMALKRKPSAESAQSMLRQECNVNLPILKQSDLATISQALYKQAQHIEEWIESTQKCLIAEDSQNSESNKKDDTISISLSTFNSLISQLTIKIAERDHEREIYMRENQRLREQKKL
ncbi:rho guanine nucleotide exchange factor 12-like [Chironomus tepperi]|uniref:rho guanine nucleotide exchange factor 12-like n=1 Tax=Chironomus tepperi TaxID=113505 RepID=UPI00391F8C29